MQSCDLIITISALACSIAKDKTADEIALLSSVFSQLGDTLATIAAQNALCTSGGANMTGNANVTDDTNVTGDSDAADDTNVNGDSDATDDTD